MVDSAKDFIAEPDLLLRLKTYLKNEKNILFIGKHGCGKTTVIRKLWESEGLKYRMFSASTMDPWVDFIGIPKEKTDEDGKSYLDFIRSRDFQDDEVEAILMDEYSRGHKKIRNAVMELIQFKSINGRVFKNLKIVWAAINPSDDEENDYDVEKLDPAQEDRFQIHIYMPYKPSLSYFSNKYSPEIAASAVEWWKDLENNSPEIINKVSPRRLDYALEVFYLGGDVRDVLPVQCNVSDLKKRLGQAPAMARLIEILGSKDKEKEAKKFMSIENNYSYVINSIVADNNLIDFFIPLLDSEKISKNLCSESKVLDWALKNYSVYPTVKTELEAILDAGLYRIPVAKIRKQFLKDKAAQVASWSKKPDINPDRAEIFFSVDSPGEGFMSKVEDDLNKNLSNTMLRYSILDELQSIMPKTMSLKESIKVTKLFEMVLSYGTFKFTENWDNFINMINTCIENLYNNEYNFENFKVDYPTIIEYAVKMKQESFYLLVEEKNV